jgi:hypothetical protein
MATPDNGLAAVLFSESSVKAKVADGKEISIVEETHYPFEEQIRMKIETSTAVTFPLYIRIPAWCTQARIAVNGKTSNINLTAGSYARIVRSWNNDDRITIHFPMNITLRQWEVNQQSVSVNYGPLTFSLKIDEQYQQTSSRETAIGDSHWQATADESKWPAYEIQAVSAWNYGLQCNLQHPVQSFQVIKKDWPADNFPFTTTSAPIEIKAKGRKIPGWGIDKFGLCAVLPAYPVQTTEPLEDITLIPMGAARLRISAFPHVE